MEPVITLMKLVWSMSWWQAILSNAITNAIVILKLWPFWLLLFVIAFIIEYKSK